AVIHFGVDGHNDALMILLVGLALLAAVRERHELALPLVTAAALVKFVPAILVPLFLLAARRSPRQAGAGLAASLALAAAAFAPQWAGLDTFDGVRDQGSRQTSSLATVLTFAFDSEDLARALMVGTFAAGYAYIILRVRGLVPQTFALLSLYLATVAFWFKGWYVTWPLMFGAALGGPALAVAAVWSVGPLIAPVFGAWGWLMYWWDWHRRWGIWMMETWLTASLLAPLAAGLLGVAGWRWLRLIRRGVQAPPP
ncbi:MAG TPA: glycosyltransferase 87 family protein, partial [Dehalococcoidia bacterium]|nr:glycosyltransferase 87 family protein [Dehalococcoidia bacterium]